jgi:hypothetical protein
MDQKPAAARWTFLTNHGHVLLPGAVAGAAAGDVAAQVG